jgi:hypothetical protein
MLYSDYRTAANKHIQTCKMWVAILEQEKNKEESELRESLAVLNNLYYLAGYILECSVSFAIYKSLRYPPNEDVGKLNQNGFSFQENIKYHNFQKNMSDFFVKQNKLPANHHLPFLRTGRKTHAHSQLLYETWNVGVRYETRQFSTEDVVTFVKDSIDFSNKLFRIFL